MKLREPPMISGDNFPNLKIRTIDNYILQFSKDIREKRHTKDKNLIATVSYENGMADTRINWHKSLLMNGGEDYHGLNKENHNKT